MKARNWRSGRQSVSKIGNASPQTVEPRPYFDKVLEKVLDKVRFRKGHPSASRSSVAPNNWIVEDEMPEPQEIALRPYQLLCAVCSLGEGESGGSDGAIGELLEAVRENPDVPLSLRCNAGDVFVYQDTGSGVDTAEGAEFNVRRDLEILHKLNLFPGATLPARIIFSRLLETVEEVSGICHFPSVTSAEWQGCSKGNRGCYERVREKGIDAIIPPRDAQEMAKDKEESLAAMHEAEGICVRPHILLCAVCQYGGGTRPPFPPDNLPELIQLVLKEPDRLITMAPYADWMMCAPCPSRAPGLNACVNNKGSGGLPNQMRDLRVLQKLGLTYGSTLKARDLYMLIFTRIPGTLEICKLDHSKPSVWHTGCGSATANSESYDKGRKLLMAEFGEG